MGLKMYSEGAQYMDRLGKMRDVVWLTLPVSLRQLGSWKSSREMVLANSAEPNTE
jgi:hypothetical protein